MKRKAKVWLSFAIVAAVFLLGLASGLSTAPQGYEPEWIEPACTGEIIAT